MQEFLDLRTLSINNILMCLAFAACLLIYSAYHSEFKGIKQTSYAFFISSGAFFLMGLRGYIPDVLSILLPNILFVASMALVHSGFTYFYRINTRVIKLFHLLCILGVSASVAYFSYVENSVNARIFAVSLFISIQCFFIMHTLLKGQNKANLTIAISYLLFALFFLVRGFITLTEEALNDFMEAGFMHALSIAVYELLVVITSFGVVWLVSYRVQRELRKQATRDPLTKLLNRRALENIIETEHANALRHNTPLAVVMMDIDHFKRINDTFGHSGGDDILIEIANVLMNNTRRYDSVARFGGEEFIILLPNTTAFQAGVTAENLRKKVEEHDYRHASEAPFTVTASFGATEFDLEKDSWLNVLERVDSGLYRAKAEGRNKVIVYPANNQETEALAQDKKQAFV